MAERTTQVKEKIDEIISEIISLIEEENRYLTVEEIIEHLIGLGLMVHRRDDVRGRKIPFSHDWATIRKKIESGDCDIRYIGKFRGRRYYLDSTPPENHNVDEISDMAYQILKDSPRQMRMSEIMTKLKEIYLPVPVMVHVSYIQRTLYQKYPNEFMRGSKRGFWMLKGTHELDENLFPKYCSNCGTGLKGRPNYCSNCGFRLKV